MKVPQPLQGKIGLIDNGNYRHSPGGGRRTAAIGTVIGLSGACDSRIPHVMHCLSQRAGGAGQAQG